MTNYNAQALPLLSFESQVKLQSGDHDSVIVLSCSNVGELPSLYTELGQALFLKTWSEKDANVAKEVSVHLLEEGKPLVLSPLGSLAGDYDDVRKYADAANKAMQRLRACGEQYQAPLILVEPPIGNAVEAERYTKFLEVTMLAVLANLDDDLQVREAGRPCSSIESIRFGVLGNCGFESVNGNLVQMVEAVERGRRLARDVGGSDPERMTALKCAEAITEFFKPYPHVKVEVVSELEVLKKEYPLFMSVARASLAVPRHHPCVVKLDYRSPDQSKVEEELFMVGKGVTYDTGGADIKTGGIMVGMSRDKLGAAALAGFMGTVAELKPGHLNVSVELAFVRNSVGPDSYVADEILTGRSGARVRVNNTDAEGRMAMADLLAECKERAAALPDSSKARLFTCATLTGHVVRSYGPYPAAMQNGSAKRARLGDRIKTAGELIADPFEVSSIRRDDFTSAGPKFPREDVLQVAEGTSSGSARGHQYAFAFLTIASGLDKHGLDSEQPISYVHLDIAGAGVEGKEWCSKPTACPVPALAKAFILKDN